MLNPDLIIWLVSQAVVAAAIYGGIRADIKNIHKRLDFSDKSTNHAHDRIDEILQNMAK